MSHILPFNDLEPRTRSPIDIPKQDMRLRRLYMVASLQMPMHMRKPKKKHGVCDADNVNEIEGLGQAGWSSWNISEMQASIRSPNPECTS